jgi:hypothetical protein
MVSQNFWRLKGVLLDQGPKTSYIAFPFIFLIFFMQTPFISILSIYLTFFFLTSMATPAFIFNFFFNL